MTERERDHPGGKKLKAKVSHKRPRWPKVFRVG